MWRANPAAEGSTLISLYADTRSRFALQIQRLERLDLNRVADQPERFLTQDDLPRQRHLFQTSRHIDGIPDRQVLALAHQHRPGVHPCAEPQLHPDLLSQLLATRSRISAAARTARNASSSRTTRDPEHRHHRVPDELLDASRHAARSSRASPAKYRLITPRRTSGSSSSPKAVDPVTSQNSAVTTLRD